MALSIPSNLRNSCTGNDGRMAWLSALPHAIRELAERWEITVHAPFDGVEGGCAWVAPATRANGVPAVLKLGMPHFEGTHEIDGLEFWSGAPTVQVFESDKPLNAMLLERCEPGASLRNENELDQDAILAKLLPQLWQTPPEPSRIRLLGELAEYWVSSTLAAREAWVDAGMVQYGIAAMRELARSAPRPVMLATDLHAGNVLRATRKPWLVIDPKPFIGDAAFDATQHLLNCDARLRRDTRGTIARFAQLLALSEERVRLWLFARAAAEPRDNWNDERLLTLARALAP